MRTLARKVRLTATVLGMGVVATLVGGCTGARLGIGLPEAVIYKNVTTPVSMKRPRGPAAGKPIEIPPDLKVGQSTAYSIDLSIPGLEVSRVLSVGWGDMSMERALEDGQLEEMIYADGQIVSILRIFNRSRLIVYGLPRQSAEADAATPPAP